MSGIRASFEIRDASACPVALASKRTGKPVFSVNRSSQLGAEGTVVEEFDLPADAPLHDGDPPLYETDSPLHDADAPTLEDLTEAFSTDETRTYRFTRDWEGCACEIVERSDSPVARVRAADGALLITVTVPDVEAVKAVVADLRAHFEEVSLQYLTQGGEVTGSDPVLVERGNLTDRQREVLQTAFDMGYFEHPRAANAGEVATALSITRSTFTEHLAAAQSKILTDILEK